MLPRKICPYCHKVFAPEKEESFCSFLCESYSRGESVPGRPTKQQICRYCSKGFVNKAKRIFCSDVCKQMCKTITQSDAYKDRIKRANERWLNPQPKKPLRKISYEALNKMAEYKRVYGKGAWDHYERGRKWDRI